MVTVVSATFFATTDEIHQIFISDCSCELRDVAIDFLGIISAVSCVLIVCYFRAKTVVND